MNCTSRITAAFAAAAFIGATGALAADLTVPYGTSTNITENATFDTVIVNGNLVVEEGVTLTATKFNIGAGLSLGQRSSVTANEGATISVSSGMTLCQNPAFSSSTSGVSDAYASSPMVSIVLNNATLDVSGSLGVNATEGTWVNGGSSVAAVFTLNGEAALLKPTEFCSSTKDQKVEIRFAGGAMQSDKFNNNGSSAFIRITTGGRQLISLVSVDGAPIRFIRGTGGLVSGLFSVSHASTTITTSGSGPFVFDGTSVRPFFGSESTHKTNVLFRHAGGFKLPANARARVDSTLKDALSNAANKDFRVEGGATLDLYGFNLAVGNIQSAGTITNSLASPAALVVDPSVGSAFAAAPAVPVKLGAYAAAGIIGGRALWYRDGNVYRTYTAPDGAAFSNLAEFTRDTAYAFTNIVELSPKAFNETPHELYMHDNLGEFNRVCVVYDGYIWNHGNSSERWTIAGGVGTHTYIRFDGVNKYPSSAEHAIPQKATFDVTPGAHRLQLRCYYNLSENGAVNLHGSGYSGDWTWTIDGIGGGVRIDRQGRDSTDVANYEKIEDPGDGSLLTVSPDGVPVLRGAPSFATYQASDAASLDVFGNKVEIGRLSGFTTVTDSHPYYDGTLSVTESWAIDGAAVAVGGTLGLDDGVAFEWGGDASISVSGVDALAYETGYAILTTTTPMSSVPAIAQDSPDAEQLRLRLSADACTLILTRNKAATVIYMR